MKVKKKKKGKKNVNSTKITIDKLEFASKLEAFAYKELKAAGLHDRLKYEPKQFVIVDPFEFDGKKYQSIKITPDFVDEENKIILEIKGFLAQNALFPMRWKLMKKYFADNKLDYKVFMAMSNQANVTAEIEKIKEIYKNIDNV